MFISADHVNDLYRECLSTLLTSGSEVSPRGINTLEITGVQLKLTDARNNVLTSPARKLNYSFMVAEWVWMLLGRSDKRFIEPFNSRVAQFAEDDHFRGAYGPKIVEQLGYVKDCLLQDTYSRQAVINLWRERPRISLDVPCTLSMQFLIRNEQVHAVTTMRSNDAWLGLPYDLFSFTQIQAYLADMLELRVGSYTHNVGSFHLYEKDVINARLVCNEDERPRFTMHPPTYPLPPAFEAMAIGLPLLGTEYGFGNVESWLEGNVEHMPAPWGDYLRVMAFKMTKNPLLVPPEWRGVMLGEWRYE